MESYELLLLKKELVTFYSREFTGGNRQQALKDLEKNPTVTARKKDLVPTYLFLGLSIGFFIVMIVLFFTPL